MKEIYTDSVQNRFGAYLVAAVGNQRIRYFAKRNRCMEREQLGTDALEKNYMDFGEQLHKYQCERSEEVLEQMGGGQTDEQMMQVVSVLEGELLIKAIRRLKEHERRLLFARVFEELSFDEIGKALGMESRQAEMAYYYIIRKLRKGMEGWNDEF